MVVIAKPRDLRHSVQKGAFVRFTVPDSDKDQLRLPVLVPHIKIPMSMTYAFICGLAPEMTGKSQRETQRFNTSRFRTLFLQLPDLNNNYLVIDICESGLKIQSDDNGSLRLFEPGNEITPAHLRLGNRGVIELDSLVPCFKTDNTVGLKMTVKEEGPSRKHLKNLLDKLLYYELKQLQIVSA